MRGRGCRSGRSQVRIPPSWSPETSRRPRARMPGAVVWPVASASSSEADRPRGSTGPSARGEGSRSRCRRPAIGRREKTHLVRPGPGRRASRADRAASDRDRSNRWICPFDRHGELAREREAQGVDRGVERLACRSTCDGLTAPRRRTGRRRRPRSAVRAVGREPTAGHHTVRARPGPDTTLPSGS